jgi:hypothetical protein
MGTFGMTWSRVSTQTEITRAKAMNCQQFRLAKSAKQQHDRRGPSTVLDHLHDAPRQGHSQGPLGQPGRNPSTAIECWQGASALDRSQKPLRDHGHGPWSLKDSRSPKLDRWQSPSGSQTLDPCGPCFFQDNWREQVPRQACTRQESRPEYFLHLGAFAIFDGILTPNHCIVSIGLGPVRV